MANVREFDQAVAVASHIERDRPYAQAHASIALAHAANGNSVEAAKSFDYALAVAYDIPVVDPKDKALLAIAKAQLNAGYIEHALDTLEDMFYPKYRAKVLSIIAAKQWANGNFMEASMGFAQALSLTYRLEHPDERAVSRRAIIGEMASVNFLSHNELTSLAPDLQCEWLRILALQQTQTGSFESAVATAGQAFGIARTIKSPYMQAWALSGIAETFEHIRRELRPCTHKIIVCESES